MQHLSSEKVVSFRSCSRCHGLIKPTVFGSVMKPQSGPLCQNCRVETLETRLKAFQKEMRKQPFVRK